MNRFPSESLKKAEAPNVSKAIDPSILVSLLIFSARRELDTPLLQFVHRRFDVFHQECRIGQGSLLPRFGSRQPEFLLSNPHGCPILLHLALSPRRHLPAQRLGIEFDRALHVADRDECCETCVGERRRRHLSDSPFIVSGYHTPSTVPGVIYGFEDDRERKSRPHRFDQREPGL